MIPSFPFVPVTKADVVLLSAPYDVTTSFGKGADKGPAAVLSALTDQIEGYDRLSGTEPFSTLGIAHLELPIRTLTPERMVKVIADTYATLGKAFPLLLGGEHAITNGPLQALVPQAKDVTVLHIDAHLDLRDSDADYNPRPYGKYAHSCVMRRAHELGFSILPVGVRTYAKEELVYAKKHDIRFFEWGQSVPSVGEIIKAIPTKKVYLTLDVDGIDPAHMPATGTPVQGGLEWWYALDLIRQLFHKKQVIGADVVEVSPRPNDQMTEYGAAQLIYTMLAGITSSESPR